MKTDWPVSFMDNKGGALRLIRKTGPLPISAPFWVIRKGPDINGENMGVVLLFHDYGGNEHIEHVGIRELLDDPKAVCVRLNRLGLYVVPKRENAIRAISGHAIR